MQIRWKVTNLLNIHAQRIQALQILDALLYLQFFELDLDQVLNTLLPLDVLFNHFFSFQLLLFLDGF